LNDKRDEMRKNEKMRFILYTYEGIKLVMQRPIDFFCSVQVFFFSLPT
jgi:hypothetical protein